MWGFNFGGGPQGRRGSLADKDERNTFLDDYKQKSIHSQESIEEAPVVENRTVNPNDVQLADHI